MAKRKALLHWCDSSAVMRILDGGSVQVGKPVIMRADWLPGYDEPTTFDPHEEASLLQKIWRKLGGRWHPMNPLLAYTPVPGISLAREPWIAGVSEVTRQSGYYFTDHRGHASGSLHVSGATSWTRTTTCIWNGVELVLPAGFGVKIPAEVGDTTVVTGVGANKDPHLRVDMLTPWAEGELNLPRHVRMLVDEQFDRLLRNGLEAGFDRPSDGALFEATDGYLSTDVPWTPQLSEDSYEIDVDDLQPGRVEVLLPPEAAQRPCKTAFALRLVNVEDPDDYVISDIVLLDSDGDSLRVQT